MNVSKDPKPEKEEEQKEGEADEDDAGGTETEGAEQTSADRQSLPAVDAPQILLGRLLPAMRADLVRVHPTTPPVRLVAPRRRCQEMPARDTGPAAAEEKRERGKPFRLPPFFLPSSKKAIRTGPNEIPARASVRPIRSTS